MERGGNGRRGRRIERCAPLSEEKALKGEAQERSRVKQTWEDREKETAAEGETSRAERAGVGTPGLSGLPAPHTL